MLEIIGWKIYYSNSTFTSEDGAWEEAPDQDVQAVEYIHESPYKTLTYGEDFYNLPGHDAIKCGAWMEENEFNDFIKSIFGDK